MHLDVARRAAALLAVSVAALACRGGDARQADASPPRSRAPDAHPSRVAYRSRVEVDTAYPPVVDGFAELVPPPSRRAEWDLCRHASMRDTTSLGPVSDVYLERGVAILCPLRAHGAVARIVVRGHRGIPGWADVYVPAGVRTPVQRLQLEPGGSREYHGADWVMGEDLNGDGWTDLKLGGTPAAGDASSYRHYSVFVYDSATRRFVRAEGLSGKQSVSREPGEPCAITASSPADVWVHQKWCWRGGRFALTEQRVRRDLPRQWDTIRVLLDSISVPRDGRLELAEIDTVRHVTHVWRPGDPRPSTAPPLPYSAPD